MRLIDADELKKHAFEVYQANGVALEPYMVVPLGAIDKAPTVEPRIEYGTDGQPYRLFMSSGQVVPDTLQGWRYEERPRGECRTCIHRDPEDKKCDCGGLERVGCSFPVSDDYFCKFYEKGGAE